MKLWHLNHKGKDKTYERDCDLLKIAKNLNLSFLYLGPLLFQLYDGILFKYMFTEVIVLMK